MRRGSYDKNNVFKNSQNAMGGHSRFPTIAGHLQKMAKVQQMAKNTQTTKFPMIQMTSARVPVIMPNKMLVANQGLAEIPVKNPDVKPYVRYGESFASLLSGRYPPVMQTHLGGTGVHHIQAAAQRSCKILDNPFQPHLLANPSNDQFTNRPKRPRTGQGRVPKRENIEAAQAEARRREKMWSCINKTNVSASALKPLVKATTRANVISRSDWVGTGGSGDTVGAAPPSVWPNSPRIVAAASPPSIESPRMWDARTSLPPITNLSVNAKKLLQQAGAREQAPLVLIDLENETETQDSNGLMETQTSSMTVIIKKGVSEEKNAYMVPHGENKEAARAEARRREKMWSCIIKTNVSASVLKPLVNRIEWVNVRPLTVIVKNSQDTPAATENVTNASNCL